MTDRQVPDVLLERFLAGDLGADVRQRVEASRDADPRVRTRLEELAAERQAFLEADPPAEFARRLAGRLEMEGAAAAAAAAAPARPRRWIAWLLGPSVAAAAAAALVVTFTVTRGPDEPTAVLMDAEPQAPAGAVAAAPAEVAADELEEKPAAQAATAPMREPAAKSDYAGHAGAKSRKRKKERLKAGPSKTPRPGPVTTAPPPPEPEAEPKPKPTFDAVDSTSTAEAADGGGGGSGGLPRSGLSQQEISKALQREVADLHACVKPAEDVPAGHYTVVISWTITPRGTVEKPRLESPKSLRKTTLSRCLVREMRTWKFRRAASPTKATLPLKFEVK